MSITDKVKLNLRIDSDAFDDDEIGMLIDAAKEDLYRSGIKRETIDDEDPVIARAIVLFCKAGFGMDADTQEKWKKAYDAYKNSLSLSLDYGGDPK